MCDPISVGAMALSAVGSLVQATGQRAAQSAVGRARDAEFGRQDRFGAEQLGRVDSGVSTFERPAQDKKLGDAIARREGVYRSAVTQPTPINGIPGQGSVNRVITDDAASRASRQEAGAGRMAAARAALEGYDDLSFGNAIETNRTAGDVGLVSGLRRGSQAILPLELEAAKRKGAGKRMLGDLLVMGGQMLGKAGGGAGGSGGGASLSQIRAGGFDPTAGVF